MLKANFTHLAATHPVLHGGSIHKRRSVKSELTEGTRMHRRRKAVMDLIDARYASEPALLLTHHRAIFHEMGDPNFPTRTPELSLLLPLSKSMNRMVEW